MARVLMVIAPRDFRDEELFDTRAGLERAGHTCVIASSAARTCSGTRGRRARATQAIDQVDTAEFDVVVFVGGPGAAVFFDDPAALEIARTMHRQHKVVAAICIAPTVLARAGVLRGKRATAFESEIGDLRAVGATYMGPGVVVDGSIVTASGPDRAVAFGKAIARLLQSRAHDAISG